MKTFSKELDKAIKRLSVDAGKIRDLLAEAAAFRLSIPEELEDIRDEAYTLIDACDVTEDEGELDFIDIPLD